MEQYMFIRQDQIRFQAGNYWLVDVGLVFNEFHVVIPLEIGVDYFGQVEEAEVHSVCTVPNEIYGQYITYSMAAQYPEIPIM